MKEIIMTSEKFEELKARLEYLKTQGRDEAAARISEARSYGDLSENSEYDEAMNEQAKMEAEIADIEAQLKNARILEESEMSSEHVHIGSIVRVSAGGKEYTYTISGATEADPFNGKISDESPVGKALMGLKVGESGEAILPNGSIVIYTVVEISK